MQHQQSKITFHDEKYVIKQKPKYLKVYLANPADSSIIQNSISLLKTVKKVNITDKQKGDLTVHHASGKADATMEKEVKQILINYYSYALEDNISLKHINRLIKLLENNSPEKKLLNSAIKSYNEFRFRHAFDDYRLCIEYYVRRIFKDNNKTLENVEKDLLKIMKEKGFAQNLITCIKSIISNFYHYQDANVKHHDNISLIDTMCIFIWGNMLLEQLILLNKMLNWK